MGQRWLGELAAKVAMADSPEHAVERVTEWAAQIGDDDRFAQLLTETAGRTYLAGQLMVRSIELADEAGAPGTVQLARSVHTRDANASFLAMPYEEALRFFRDKQVISAAEFDALEDRFKTGGFVARRLASERLQEVARAAIESLLAQDLTIPEVVRAIRDAEAPEIAGLGIAPSSPAYLDNIVRTNCATAYGAGRFAAMNDPAVVLLRPWQQYWTAGDDRVTDGHKALHGLVFRAGGELASRYSPPLRWRCRCSMTTCSQRQFESRGLVETTTRIAATEAEPFWDREPALLTEADV
jgi:SPP1 gp7 family putative phage head morphogenesis protein